MLEYILNCLILKTYKVIRIKLIRKIYSDRIKKGERKWLKMKKIKKYY